MVVPSELLHIIGIIVIVSLYYNVKQYHLIKFIYALKAGLKEEVQASINQETNTKYNLQYICNNPEVIKSIRRKLFTNK